MWYLVYGNDIYTFVYIILLADVLMPIRQDYLLLIFQKLLQLQSQDFSASGLLKKH